MTVSVVIPCLNEERHIGYVLEALREQTASPSEIVAVDGGSEDGTVHVLEAFAARIGTPTVTVLSRPGISIPGALNTAVGAAHGDIVVRLDAHAVPSKEYLADAASMLSDPAIGVVGGIWRIMPGAETPTARAIARAGAHPLGAGDAAYRVGSLTTPTDVDTVPFGCFRRAVWEELGGYDERLHANEDYEFNHRVLASGRRVVLDPRLACAYFARPTLGALAHQYFRYGWWKVQMLRKHPGSLRWRQAVPLGFVATLLLLAISGAAGVGWKPLVGVAGVYAGVLTAAAAVVCQREGEWDRLVRLAAALAVMHVSWGAGGIANLVTTSRWPYRVPRGSPREAR